VPDGTTESRLNPSRDFRRPYGTLAFHARVNPALETPGYSQSSFRDDSFSKRIVVENRWLEMRQPKPALRNCLRHQKPDVHLDSVKTAVS
jgi:hypothetical protein